MTNHETNRPIEIKIRGATLPEVMTFFPVLREYVAIEVGDARESFLFVRGLFVGPEIALSRLRALLTDANAVDVKLVSHIGPEGLYGASITALELLLDPDRKLGG